MGATIAAHLANVGIPVLLMDIVPPGSLPPREKEGTDSGQSGRSQPSVQCGKRGTDQEEARPPHESLV